MSFFPKKIKSKYFLLSFFLSFFIISSLFFYVLSSKKLSFRELTNQLFFEDVTTDTISLHYTIAYPSHYSIDTYPLTLPEYNQNTLKDSKLKIENSLAILSNTDPSKLSSEEFYCYNLLQDYFKMQKKGFPYTYYEECFSPSSGIVANYPILMAEYTFRSQKDVTDYLSLLKDTPDYFSDYFEFQKERAKKGHYLATSSLQQTLKQCDTIITKEALDENSHFLQLTFRERLAPLVAKDIITKKEASLYIEENQNLLKNIVLPAYQNLKTSLSSLQPDSIPLQGLYQKEQGRKYYEWLVQKQIGCHLSIEELLKKLETDYEKNLFEFRSLQEKINTYPNYEKYINQPFPLQDRNEMLKLLQKFILKDFPSLSSYSDRPLKTTIKSVSSCMEEYTSPAFYMIPPIDDIWKNTIYINNSSTPKGLDLFTTLAHEGYPGHLYQTVYYQLYSNENDIPLIRQLLNYGGYVEGWAIYCEFYSYDYAAGLYPKESREFYSLWHNLLLCDKKLQLGILSILDIYLHYYDDSLETAKDILSQYGIADDETVSDIYQYVLEEPGNYLKYYAGYLMIMDLKEKARTIMGSDFTDMKFHEFILNAGPSDFDNLEERLINY